FYQIFLRRILNTCIALASIDWLSVREQIMKDAADVPAGGVVVSKYKYMSISYLLAQSIQLRCARCAEGAEYRNTIIQQALKLTSIVLAFNNNSYIHCNHLKW